MSQSRQTCSCTATGGQGHSKRALFLFLKPSRRSSQRNAAVSERSSERVDIIILRTTSTQALSYEARVRGEIEFLPCSANETCYWESAAERSGGPDEGFRSPPPAAATAPTPSTPSCPNNPSLISSMFCMRFSRSCAAFVSSGLPARPCRLPPPPAPLSVECPLELSAPTLLDRAELEGSEDNDVDGVMPRCCIGYVADDGAAEKEPFGGGGAWLRSGERFGAGPANVDTVPAGLAEAGPLDKAACAVEYGADPSFVRGKPGRAAPTPAECGRR